MTLRPAHRFKFTENVSRETFSDAAPDARQRSGPRRRAARCLVPLAALPAVLLLATACGGPPGPIGWAPAQPVEVAGQGLVLVPYNDDLYALEDGSTSVQWQFPPQDKDTYPLSEARRAALVAAAEQLDIDDVDKENLTARIEDLTVEGGSIDALTDAVDATSAPADQKDALNELIDSATDLESGALGDVDALYGDIAIDSDATTAFVPSFGGWLFAIDIQSGFTRWIVDAQDEMVGGVEYEDGSIYFGTKDSRVYGLDAETGEQQWLLDTDGEVWTTPTFADGAVYVPSFEGTLYKIDAASGEVDWTFTGADAGIAARATIDGDTLYIGAFDDRLYAIDTGDGSMKWSMEADNWFWAQAVVDSDTVYAANLDGKVYAVNAADGERRWDPFGAGSEIRSTPVIAGDALVVAGRDGLVHKVDLANGEPMGAAADLLARIDADLAVVDDAVYAVPRNRTLYVIDAGADLAATSFPLP